MKSQRELIQDRLKNVMLTDRTNNVDKLLIVLKSDLTELLKNYMYVEPQNININLAVSPDGEYNFEIGVTTDCLISPGKMIE